MGESRYEITGRRVLDHGEVGIGIADDEGRVRDFAGVPIGRVVEDGVVEDFGHVHLGRVVPRAAA